MKPKATWSFTDAPDYARICREAEAQAGCTGVVFVKSKSRREVTLVHMGCKIWPQGALVDARKSAVDLPGEPLPAFWYAFAGNWTKQFLGVEAHTVEVY